MITISVVDERMQVPNSNMQNAILEEPTKERGVSEQDHVNILLVDDQPESLLALRATLENEPYTLVTAASGPEALARLLDTDFAVIVLDIRMPGMDGYEVAEMIRGRERSQHTPIIFLTAATQAEGDEFKAYEAGATDYIVKPVIPAVLRDKVAVFVDLHLLHVKLQQKLEETRLLNRALESSNRALARSESQLRELNANLEHRVLERTDALQNAEEKYRSIFENAREGIVQVSPEGKIMTANPALAHILGYSSSEELVSAETEWDQAIMDPNDRAELQRQLTERGSVSEFHVLIQRKDGRARWISINAHRVCGADGALNCYEGTVEDVTERRRIEDALRFLTEAGAVLASSLDYERTLEAVSDLAVPRLADWCSLDLLQEDGSLEQAAVKTIQAENTNGGKEGDERQKRLFQADGAAARVIHTGQPEIYSALDSRAVSASNLGDLQVFVDAGMKSAMLVPLTARNRTLGVLSLFSMSTGRLYSMPDLVLAQEFARRAALAVDNGRLYRESQSAVVARDHFLAVASHELKTPLTVITGYVELEKRMIEASLRRGQESGDSNPRLDIDHSVLLRQINHLHNASTRLTQLVNDLLDINRMQTRSLELAIEPFDLSALFSSVVENFVTREQARQHPVEFIVSRYPGEIPGWWDRSRLEQVLVNLIDNAIKYSSARGLIELEMSLEEIDEHGKQAHLVVRDHGIGIPPEEQGKVFQPFMRATNAPARNFPGLGLGLAITRDIVERHGGRITVESAGFDQGTTFHVILPVLDHADKLKVRMDLENTPRPVQPT